MKLSPMQMVGRERPILMRDAMVRAILAGNKTETRRVVRPQPLLKGNEPTWHHYQGLVPCHPRSGNPELCDAIWGGPQCPYGQAGDRFWVREAWCKGEYFDEEGEIWYRANPDDLRCFEEGGMNCDTRWRSPIHMPRLISRITLKIISVEPQRLQEIAEDGAIAEGVDEVSMEDVPRQTTWSKRQDFAQLWDSMHAKPKPIRDWKKRIVAYVSYPWGTPTPSMEVKEYRGRPWVVFGNPWVWTIRFQVVKHLHGDKGADE